MTSGGKKRRRGVAATVAVLCVLVASLAVAVGSAAGEEGDAAPIRPVSDGRFNFPEITSAFAPEEYPFQWGPLSPELTMRQVDDQEIVVEYKNGPLAYVIQAVPAADAYGATVPTTVKLTEEDIVTLTVRYRSGNPAAGGAPYVFPITEGEGWEGGWHFGKGEFFEPDPIPMMPTVYTPNAPSGSTVTCTVPSLHGLSLHAAKARLRAAHCSIGQVRLAPEATDAKGEVVKQFHAPGTGLAAGAPVAVKLGPRPNAG